MDEQLTLDLQQAHVPALYSVRFYKNGDLLASTQPDSLQGANVKRRSLVGLLQRSPHCLTQWEEDPRSTGWFGLKSDPPQGAAVYHITIERD